MRYLLVINPEAQLGVSKRKQNALIKTAYSVLGKGKVFIVGKDRKETLKDANFEAVIFCGGDGTLHYGLQYVPLENTKVGLIPLGSGVDFASALGIPKRYKEAFEVIHRGETKRVDLGRINGRLFANTVSFGFDAFINRLQDLKIRPRMKRLKRYLLFLDAKWCYIVALLYFFLPWVRFEPIKLEIESDTSSLTEEVFMLSITNSFRYGGGFKINPQAKIDDGWLDASLVLPLSKWSIFKKAYSVWKGTHILDPTFRIFRFTKMIVKSATPINAQVDGEMLIPACYFEIDILKRMLEVFVP